MKAQRRAIDGVLLLDKPQGLSSNAVLQRVKKLYNAEKAGHSGTLDPLATGLLPILLGEATKFGSGLLDSDKSYEAELRLGVRTSTGDAEGEVLATRPVNVDAAAFEQAAARFRGPIQQVPPMHSALKRDGKALYEYARAGQTVERKPRAVIIHELVLESFEAARALIRVRCSKGTYIRTLAEDIGEMLGCGAHLAALRRTGAGSFSLDRAVSLAALEEMDEAARDACLLPLDSLLGDLPALPLDAEQSRRFRLGQALEGNWKMDGCVRVLGDSKNFLGLGRVEEDGRLHPQRLLRN